MRNRKTTVEIICGDTSGKFRFANDNLLNGKHIVGVSIPANAGGNLLAPSGVAVVTDAALGAATLTLSKDADALVDSVPLVHFQESSGDRSMRPVDWSGFNPGKSEIIFQKDPGTGNHRYTVGQAVVVIVEYHD